MPSLERLASWNHQQHQQVERAQVADSLARIQRVLDGDDAEAIARAESMQVVEQLRARLAALG